MEINEIQDEIIDEFSALDDWMDRYQLIIEMAQQLEPLDEKHRIQQNLIEGCQSRVWLQADLTPEGNIHYTGDSDAVIVKGLVALVLRVLNDHTPDEILGADLYFIEAIGLKENLSPTRSNGFMSMIKQARIYALAFKQIDN